MFPTAKALPSSKVYISEQATGQGVKVPGTAEWGFITSSAVTPGRAAHSVLNEH